MACQLPNGITFISPQVFKSRWEKQEPLGILLVYNWRYIGADTGGLSFSQWRKGFNLIYNSN